MVGLPNLKGHGVLNRTAPGVPPSQSDLPLRVYLYATSLRGRIQLVGAAYRDSICRRSHAMRSHQSNRKTSLITVRNDNQAVFGYFKIKGLHRTALNSLLRR